MGNASGLPGRICGGWLARSEPVSGLTVLEQFDWRTAPDFSLHEFTVELEPTAGVLGVQLVTPGPPAQPLANASICPTPFT